MNSAADVRGKNGVCGSYGQVPTYTHTLVYQVLNGFRKVTWLIGWPVYIISHWNTFEIGITIKKPFAIAKETYYLCLFWLINSTFELIGSRKIKASHHLKWETSRKVSVGTVCFHLPRRRPLAVLLLLRFLHAASSYTFTIQFPSLNEAFRLTAWVLTLNSWI